MDDSQHLGDLSLFSCQTVYFMNFLVQHCRTDKTLFFVLEISVFSKKNTLRNLPNPTPFFPNPQTRNIPRRGVLESCVDQVVAAKVPTLERLGGGSVRCMLAELFKRRGPVEAWAVGGVVGGDVGG